VTDDARLERPLTTGRMAWMADRWLAGCSQDTIGAAVDRDPSTVSSCISRFCEITGHRLYGLLGEEVRVHRGEAVGRLYSGWRLRFSRENAPSCRPIGKELISIDVPSAAR
jgi:hypothetical protein